ncbi:hypothetical protein SJ05684_c21710 [Sinorhizobium sojae CCBAU 05684]|uniref:Uncharacterized protein n=1 Tax=Sinorhizobium sojae CCBAU 05684 TaxID=716928 RepID=A0A249PCX0_9HYPH|nr:hypothetical protein SJ05684_c21710 [Sinorhizobium sojae CCBAU 05684]
MTSGIHLALHILIVLVAVHISCDPCHFVSGCTFRAVALTRICSRTHATHGGSLAIDSGVRYVAKLLGNLILRIGDHRIQVRVATDIRAGCCLLKVSHRGIVRLCEAVRLCRLQAGCRIGVVLPDVRALGNHPGDIVSRVGPEIRLLLKLRKRLIGLGVGPLRHHTVDGVCGVGECRRVPIPRKRFSILQGIKSRLALIRDSRAFELLRCSRFNERVEILVLLKEITLGTIPRLNFGRGFFGSRSH